MIRWMMAAGLAVMALPGIATANNADYSVRGCATAQPCGYSAGGQSCQTTCYTPSSCCNGCSLFNWCNIFCAGCWEFEGQGLYWRTCGDDRIFALQDSVVDNDHTFIWHAVKPDNDWGFRLKGKYATCDGCQFFSLSYLYYDQTDHGIAGANSTLENPYFGSAFDAVTAHLDPEYQRLDGRVGRYVCCSSCGGFYGYGGLSWIYIRDAERLDAVNATTAAFLTQSSRFSAAGFEAGFGGHYYLCGRFGIAGEFGGIAAVGKRCTKFETASTVSGVTTSFVFRKPSVSTCAPGLDLKLELFYECFVCCHNITLMIGYEEQYYFNPTRLNRLFFGDDQASALRFSERKDFGVGGLYLGGKVLF